MTAIVSVRGKGRKLNEENKLNEVEQTSAAARPDALQNNNEQEISSQGKLQEKRGGQEAGLSLSFAINMEKDDK